jgi:plastocyanin
MTDTTTDPPDPAAAEPEAPAEPRALEAPADPVKEAWKTRAILPLALPILAAVATMVWVVNLSRTFLAGGKTGALVIVMIVTVTIMLGASMMSAAKRMRDSSQLLLTSGLVAVIITAGFISLGPSEPHEAESAGYQQPKGPAVATLTVEALASLKFDKTQYDIAPAGITEVVYVQGGGTHDLHFTDPAFEGFVLNVPPKQDKGKVELEPGEYTIYCNLPGHRAAGMEATVFVAG